jgi:23S rRNA (uracil1939-C5)-methyltransferase
MLSTKFKRVALVESDPTAVRDARLNLSGLNAAVHATSVEDWPKEGVGEPGDVLLLDPPRAGLAKRIVAGLNESRANTLVLIGCDGANFCRDVQRLSPAWRLSQLAVVDLFPNTPHVECVGLFERNLETVD